MNWFELLRAAHVLGAVIWVGGMFFAYVVLRPSLAVLEPPQRMALHGQVFRRFFLVVWHAMPVLLLTGFIMLFGFYGGMGNVEWPVHVMLMFGLIMSAIFLAIFFGPYRRFRSATQMPEKAAAANTIRTLIGVNLLLGLITIFLVIAG